jgi:hypothetical protein
LFKEIKDHDQMAIAANSVVEKIKYTNEIKEL